MSDISKGFTFTGQSPGNQVTAQRLNNLVDSATILPGFYNDKPSVTTLPSDAVLLAYDPGSSGYVKITKANALVSARSLTGARNLRLYSNSASTVTLDADEIVMRSDTNDIAIGYNVAQTINITTSGSNGLDVGAETQNTWYFIWAISEGTETRGLFSTSATAPTMPDGFIYKCLLGAVRNDNSSNFVRFSQRDNEVCQNFVSDAGTSSAQLNPYSVGVEFNNLAFSAANTFQTVDLSRCIPPNIVARVQGIIGHTSTTDGNLRAYGVATQSDGALNSMGLDNSKFTPGVALIQTRVVTGQPVVGGFTGLGTFDVAVRTSQQIAAACNTTTGSIHSMRITGYTLAL